MQDSKPEADKNDVDDFLGFAKKVDSDEESVSKITNFEEKVVNTDTLLDLNFQSGFSLEKTESVGFEESPKQIIPSRSPQK